MQIIGAKLSPGCNRRQRIRLIPEAKGSTTPQDLLGWLPKGTRPVLADALVPVAQVRGGVAGTVRAGMSVRALLRPRPSRPVCRRFQQLGGGGRGRESGCGAAPEKSRSPTYRLRLGKRSRAVSATISAPSAPVSAWRLRWSSRTRRRSCPEFHFQGIALVVRSHAGSVDRPFSFQRPRSPYCLTQSPEPAASPLSSGGAGRLMASGAIRPHAARFRFALVRQQIRNRGPTCTFQFVPVCV